MRRPTPRVVVAGSSPLPPAAALQPLLDALADVAEAEVAAGVPAYWEAPHVRYRRERRGREDWAAPSELLRRGWGDCEDLAAWLAGSLRARGVDARAVLRPAPGGWHAVVVAGGSTLDPSRERGMR